MLVNRRLILAHFWLAFAVFGVALLLGAYFGISAVGFTDGTDPARMEEAAEAARAQGRVGLIMLETPANLIHIIVNGGFPPSTPGDPRPYGMPPFAGVLSDNEVAAVVSYIRTAWGNRGTPVSARDANELRSAPLD